MILNENEHQQPIFKRNRIQLKCTKGSPNRVIRTYSSLSKITLSRMWGDNTKGLSSTGLLRPTNISFGFAGTKIIIIMIIIMIINFLYIYIYISVSRKNDFPKLVKKKQRCII